MSNKDETRFRIPWRRLFALAACWTLALAVLRNCNNDPWPDGASGENTLFTTFNAEIRSLDPSAVNFTHESAVLDNIMEAPLAYHYLKRPYTLVPMMLEALPEARYYDREGRVLEGDPDPSLVARTEYTLNIRPGILYQPHPCFAGDSAATCDSPGTPWDFGPLSQREATAEDFVVSLSRLCDPRSGCTVFAQLAGFIEGLHECRRELSEEIRRLDARRLESGETPSEIASAPSIPDYRRIAPAGIEALDSHTVRYTLSRKYPQFLYWLTMHYFAPIPYETFEFHGRPDVIAAGIKYADWPVANGAYMLRECDLDFRIVLERNPNYHDARFPSEGNAGDEEAGLLDDAGKRLPFVDKVVFNWEPESIPSWTKFTQGYYDDSGLPVDMFDKAISVPQGGGELSLSPEMAEKGMKMTTAVPPVSYYYAFNMRDPVVGGLGKRQRLLRQAVSIAMDTRQFIDIFRNGNGVVSEGIIPPGIFGAAEPPVYMNNIINTWNGTTCVRRSIEDARRLLAEAGYPGGRDEATGEQLVLYLDHAAAGKPDFKSRFQWISDQIGRLGIRVEERGFDLNRSRRRISEGNWQFLYGRAWVADYPDPENFLMLFASENGQVEHHGPNYSNYSNPEYDALFHQLETMPDTPRRLELIRQASEILYRDAPVVWDIHPKNMALTHGWVYNYLPQSIAYDNLKYLRVDPAMRVRLQKEWNAPCTWPVLLLMAVFTVASLIPRRER